MTLVLVWRHERNVGFGFICKCHAVVADEIIELVIDIVLSG